MEKVIVVLGVLLILEAFLICYKIGIKIGTKRGFKEVFDGAKINLTEFNLNKSTNTPSDKDDLTFLGIVYDLDSPTYKLIKDGENVPSLDLINEKLIQMQEKLHERENALSKIAELDINKLKSLEYELVTTIAQAELMKAVLEITKGA